MDSLFSRRAPSGQPSLISSQSNRSSSFASQTNDPEKITSRDYSPSAQKYDHNWTVLKENDENCIPAWKRPLRRNLHREIQTQANEKRCDDDIDIYTSGTVSDEIRESEATAKLIQILLPCIICNRTFSPEALERHSKICSNVNLKDPRRPIRGKFDSSEQRKKETPLADYIPPPPVDANGDFVRTGSRRHRESFKRGSHGRSSLGKSTSGTSISSDMSPSWNRAVSPAGSRIAASVQSNSSSENPCGKNSDQFDNNSEFGSEGSHETNGNVGNSSLPSYARALSPTEDCPFCGRNFNLKAFDRHVKFCQDQFIKKQYDIQPTPKEKEEALERQEIRTKYRPLKSSSSCGSLRSMSPGKDLSNLMAMKLYGFMNRNLGKGSIFGFKRSNESLPNSCYGDYNQNTRRSSPARSIASNPPRPALLQRSATTMGMTNYNYHANSRKAPILSTNRSSNFGSQAKKTKSIENVNNYANVMSSGYGQQYLYPSPFVRNSRTHSSLHKNFFRNSSKRAEPDGTESITSNYHSQSLKDSPVSSDHYSSQSPTIYPTNSYTKPATKVSMIPQYQYHNVPKPNYHSSPIMSNNSNTFTDPCKKVGSNGSSNSNYDPYEKAAKQFEELLKTQPLRTGSSTNPTRKFGLNRAFQSVTQPIVNSVINGSVILSESHPERELESIPSRLETNNNFTQQQRNIQQSLAGCYPIQEPDKSHTDMDQFVFNPTPDESYWNTAMVNNDETSKTGTTPGNREQHNRHSPSASLELNADSGNGKSRASDLNSSSDKGSVYTPSDGADLEFEALESLMSLRDATGLTTNVNSRHKNSDYLASRNNLGKSTQDLQDSKAKCARDQKIAPDFVIMASESPPMTTLLRDKAGDIIAQTVNLRRKNENSTDDYRRWNLHNNDDDFKRNKEDILEPSHGSLTNGSIVQHRNDESGETSNMARFCHECGTPYPTARAKFCPECGERRAI